jgi:hypothetical protein
MLNNIPLVTDRSTPLPENLLSFLSPPLNLEKLYLKVNTPDGPPGGGIIDKAADVAVIRCEGSIPRPLAGVVDWKAWSIPRSLLRKFYHH